MRGISVVRNGGHRVVLEKLPHTDMWASREEVEEEKGTHAGSMAEIK
jgi:hypothetical protein